MEAGISLRVSVRFSRTAIAVLIPRSTPPWIGWWVSPNFAVDAEIAHNDADFEDDGFRSGREWESISLGVTGRWFFGDQGSALRPYVLGGLGAVRHAAYSGTIQHDGWDPMATVGGGVQYNFNERVALRGELAARYDRDNNSLRDRSTTSASSPRITTISSMRSRRSA